MSTTSKRIIPLITLASVFFVHSVMAQSNKSPNEPAPTSTSISPEMEAWIDFLSGAGKSSKDNSSVSQIAASIRPCSWLLLHEPQ